MRAGLLKGSDGQDCCVGLEGQFAGLEEIERMGANSVTQPSQLLDDFVRGLCPIKAIDCFLWKFRR
jgi:hypothetical protein